ncbi:MAG: transposase [Planctomycetes bacterium]|nr:transposase [Planctomycetota bacterium]
MEQERRMRFEGPFVRPIDVIFDGESQSSDGGLILLRRLDDRIGLTAALAGCLQDRRDPSRVAHGKDELFRQRVFGSPTATRTETTLPSSRPIPCSRRCADDAA